jgi:Tfp pilus assembly protein PilV
MRYYYGGNDFGDAFSRAFGMGSQMAQTERERQRQLDQNNAAFDAYKLMQEEQANRQKAPHIKNAFDAMYKASMPIMAGASGDPRAIVNAYPQAGPTGQIAGQLEAGNIDLANRPVVKNPDGSISTVRSMNFDIGDGKQILVPTVSDDGRIMSPEEAIAYSKQTGKHLGIFDSPQSAESYAKQLSAAQSGYYGGQSVNDAVSLLDQARQKYSTAIVDRLAPLVQGGKLPAGVAIQLADKYKESELKEMKRQEKSAIMKRLQLEQDPAKRQAIIGELAMLDDTLMDKYITAAMTPDKPVSLAQGAQLVDPKTGKVLADNPYKSKPMSEYEQARVAAGFGRGGSGNSDRKSKEAMFKWASGYDLVPTGEVDYNQKPIMTRKQRNPELAAALAAELGYVPEAGEQPQAGGTVEQMKPKVAQAKQAGYSDAEIAQHLGITDPAIAAQLGIDIGAKEKPIKQPTYTGSEYLGL